MYFTNEESFGSNEMVISLKADLEMSQVHAQIFFVFSFITSVRIENRTFHYLHFSVIELKVRVGRTSSYAEQRIRKRNGNRIRIRAYAKRSFVIE